MNKMYHTAKEVHSAQMLMGSLVSSHASNISRLFGGVHPIECQDPKNLYMDWMEMDETWYNEVKSIFIEFNSKVTKLLQCDGTPDCDAVIFVHTMQHVAHLLRNSVFLSLWTTSVQRIYTTLLLMVHGKCISCINVQLDKTKLCSAFSSVEKENFQRYFNASKKALNTSLCQMSADYLSSSTRLLMQPQHHRVALDTLLFKELYNLVVNNGDKRLAILFLSMLPEMMGANDMTDLSQFLSMQMHNFVIEVIKRTEAAATRKFIRLHFAAAGQCTCHTKCSKYGKVDEIQVLAVCKTCRNTPVFRPVREQRCRRTLSSNGFLNTCTVDGNTSFIYVPLYRACVNKANGQLVYEHWAYTLSLNHLGADSGTASIYMLCVGGKRTCTNVFLTESLAKTKCERCTQGYLCEETCLTEKVGKRLAALCDGCIIAACCPRHAPLQQASKEVWLSILEYFAKETPAL